MKRLWLFLSLTLCATSLCYAEVYVIVDKTTKEIYTMSEKNDTVIPANMQLVVLPGKVENLGLSDNPTNYKYDKNKFIKNQDKIDKEEQEKIKQEEIVAEKKMIDERVQKIAIDQLKAEGKLDANGKIVK